MVTLFLFMMFLGGPGWAETDTGSIDYQPGRGMQLSGADTGTPLGHTKFAEENLDPEQRAIRLAKKSTAKIIYEGFAPNKAEAADKSPPIQDSLVIETELDYSNQGKKVRTERKIFVSEEHKDWLNLTQARDGVVLLGRLLSRDSKNIKLEYLIVDTGRNDDQVISPPVLEAPLGQKMLVNLDGANEKISVTIQAKQRNI